LLNYLKDCEKFCDYRLFYRHQNKLFISLIILIIKLITIMTIDINFSDTFAYVFLFSFFLLEKGALEGRTSSGG